MDLLKGIVEGRLKPRHEEDFVDRLNYVSTPFILFSAAIVSFAKEYGPVSEPLYCWAPAEWNDQWLQYAHDYCFVESTYYIPFNQSIPMRNERNNGMDRVSYYQWLPFILVLQGLICQVPRHFWHFCNAISSKNLSAILRQAHNAVGKSRERKVAAGIGRHLLATVAQIGIEGDGAVGQLVEEEAEREQREDYYGRKEEKLIGKMGKQASRNALSFCYLAMKCLFLGINIGQFLFISLFLGIHQTPAWGLKMLDTFMTYGTSWERNGLFPRVSLCDLKIRLPDEHFADYTVQCVLMANFLNEKIMLTIYYWFVLMALLTGANILRWCCLLFCFHPRSQVQTMVELSCRQIFPDPEPSTAGGIDIQMMGDGELCADDMAEEEQQAFGMETPESPLSIYGGGGGAFAGCAAHNPVSIVNSNATTMSVLSSATTGTAATIQQHPIVPPLPTTSNCNAVANRRCQFAVPTIGQQKMPEENGPSGTMSPSSAASFQREKQKQQQINEQELKWAKELEGTFEQRAEFYKAFHDYGAEFVKLLGTDGLMIFHLIRANSGPQMASLIMGEFFNAFWQAKAKMVECKWRRQRRAAMQQQQIHYSGDIQAKRNNNNMKMMMNEGKNGRREMAMMMMA